MSLADHILCIWMPNICNYIQYDRKNNCKLEENDAF